MRKGKFFKALIEEIKSPSGETMISLLITVASVAIPALVTVFTQNKSITDSFSSMTITLATFCIVVVAWRPKAWCSIAEYLEALLLLLISLSWLIIIGYFDLFLELSWFVYLAALHSTLNVIYVHQVVKYGTSTDKE